MSHLILYGAFALGGKKRSPAEKEKRDAMTTLMRIGWGADNPTFDKCSQGFSSPEQRMSRRTIFNELQRKTTSAECAVRYFDAVSDFDIKDLLSKVTGPLLSCMCGTT